MKDFSVKVNKNSCKDMWEFLRYHYHYYTMNSWNNIRSIANNVKLYNLGLSGDYWRLLEIFEVDHYFTINSIIEMWEIEEVSNGYRVGFNGRSGGYLVLYNENNNGSVLDSCIYNDTYEDFKSEVQSYYGSLKNYKDRLLEQVELVQKFDLLCNDLVRECQYMLDNAIIEEEILVQKTIKTIRTIKYKDELES